MYDVKATTVDANRNAENGQNESFMDLLHLEQDDIVCEDQY